MPKNPVQRRTETAISDIRKELEEARNSFGTEHTLAALQEEVGELAQALIDREHGEWATDQEIYDEAIQTAAMAIRVATEGDDTFESYSPSENSDMQLVAAERWAEMSNYQKTEYILSHDTGYERREIEGEVFYQGVIGEVAVTGLKKASNHAVKAAKGIKNKTRQQGNFTGIAIPIGALG